MARSTIQEKLSGNGKLTLTQVLSIVEALAEYARDNEIPLPNQEISRDVWRDRVSASYDTGNQNSEVNTERESEGPNDIEWNTEPLEQAQMTDLVNLIREARRKPVSTWLPRLLREMVDAEMEIENFIQQAAEDTPLGIVQTLKELDKEFPYMIVADDPWGGEERRNIENQMTVDPLLRIAAQRHGQTASPAIVVAMRRSGLSHHVNTYLDAVGTWFLPENVVIISEHLTTAALTNDNRRLLRSIAQNRGADRIPQVIKCLQITGKAEDANFLLRNVGNTNQWRIRSVVMALEKESAPEEVLREIARGVPHGKHDEYAEACTDAKLENFAKLIIEARDEPPF
ncbi:hypothetical protein [Streptomyces tunisiensis]|uniref:hypothetical protein n=1 Tax=Streptomyces tunisiensis TaxID=948699 RepID=UPI00403E1F19